MNYKLQLLSFLVSFIYGIFFYITSKLNNKLIKNKSILFQYIITMLYIINLVLLYVIIIYKTNKGIFHIYFIILLVIGYIIASISAKSVKKYVKLMKSHIKIKH